MKNNLKKIILSAIIALGITAGIYSALASTIPIAPAVFETSLNTPISTSSTSMTLTSGTLANGSTLSGYACFTVDSGNPNVEFICGTASGTSITSLIRGIDTLDGKTSVASLIFAHRRGADVKITDFPVFSVIRNIANGTDTFPNIISYPSHPTFTAASQIIDKQYADSLAILGAGNADTTTQGLVQVPTQAQVDAGTQLGGSGAYLATNPALTRAKKYNDYAADSVGTDSYVITISPAITSYSAGQYFTFKAGTANTGAATLNVSGLGAKTIKKSVSSDLATGDILSGQIVSVVYDGTNMQLLSASSLASSIRRTYTANDTWSKPTGLVYALIETIGGGGGGGGGQGTPSIDGGGGGGGGYAMRRVLVSQLGATETVTIGAGGTAGSGGGHVGGTGGTTSFGSWLNSTGGNGGSFGPGTGGTGGTGSIYSVTGTTGGSGSGAGTGGNGGASYYGVTNAGGAGAGNAGPANTGSGGAGGGTANAGGIGGSGLVIVTEFY